MLPTQGYTLKFSNILARQIPFDSRQFPMPILDPVAEGPLAEKGGKSPGGEANSTTRTHLDCKCFLERPRGNESKDLSADGVFE